MIKSKCLFRLLLYSIAFCLSCQLSGQVTHITSSFVNEKDIGDLNLVFKPGIKVNGLEVRKTFQPSFVVNRKALWLYSAREPWLVLTAGYIFQFQTDWKIKIRKRNIGMMTASEERFIIAMMKAFHGSIKSLNRHIFRIVRLESYRRIIWLLFSAAAGMEGSV